MPAITTHYAFALDTMKAPERIFKEAVFLGAQGPDPFFFYGQYPFKKREDREEADAFGRDLHHMDITIPYEELIKYANLSSDKELLMSYIEGLFLHYVLDRRCHPFIFVKSGFSSDPKWKKFFAASHCRYETYLDVIIGKKYGVFTYQADKYLRINKDQLAKISLMWAEVNAFTLKKEHFDATTFAKAVTDYRHVEHMVNNPHAFQRWFLYRAAGKDSLPFAMNFPSHFTPEEKRLDFLNETHSPWPDPVTNEMHNESFEDLWERAQSDYEKAVLILQKAQTGADIHDTLFAFVDNLNHDGTHVGEEKLYMDVLWPNLPEGIR